MSQQQQQNGDEARDGISIDRRTYLGLLGGGAAGLGALGVGGDSPQQTTNIGGASMALSEKLEINDRAAGPKAVRPAAAASNKGTLWFVTDYGANNATIPTLSDGDQWIKLNVGADYAEIGEAHIDELSGTEFVFPSDSAADIQARLDDYDKRNVTIDWRRTATEYEFTLASPLEIGQHTRFEGQSGFLEEIGSANYEARPLVTAEGSQFVKTPDSGSYRVVHPSFHYMAVQGTGQANGQTGFLLLNNPDQAIDQVGYAEFDWMFIEDFDVCIDGDAQTAGNITLETTHLAFCNVGVKDAGFELHVNGSQFWDFKGTNPICIDSPSRRARIRNSFFAPKASDAICINVTGLHTSITDNQFAQDGAYKHAIFQPGAVSTIIGNKFHGTPHNSVVDLRGAGDDVAIIGNTFAPDDFSNTADAIAVNGVDGAYIAGNEIRDGWNGFKVNVNSGDDTVIWGVHPSNVRDLGTRTMVNGRYRTPPTLSLGGANGNINPVANPLAVFDLQIDAGGSDSDLQGIGNITRPSTVVNLSHTGGENVTLVHNDTTNGSDPFLLDGGSNLTLDANGEMVSFLYDAQTSKWREMWRNVQ